MAVEKCLDAGQGPAGRWDGKLLAGDLEQQGTVQVHRRELGHPRPGVEGRPVVDEPRQHGVGVAKVGARLLQPLRAAGILGHGARSLRPAGMPVTIFMPKSDNLPRSDAVPGTPWAGIYCRSRGIWPGCIWPTLIR